MLLTPVEVATLALNAGWKGEDAVTATAISFAEDSNHDTKAIHDNNAPAGGYDTKPEPGDPVSLDVGLWQIHITNRSLIEGLFDPFANASAAYAKYQTQGFNAWCVYEPSACGGNGSQEYRKHMSAARTAVAAAKKKGIQKTLGEIKKKAETEGPGIEDIPVVGPAVDAITSIPGAIASFIVRFGYVLAGLALLIVSFYTVVKTGGAS